MDAHLTSLRASPSAWLFALASPKACGFVVASPKACGGPVRRFGGAVGAERADFPSVLGLAAPSRNSLRARWALRSDKRDENVYERASRWAASPARLGAPQARRTGPPHALGDELLVRGGFRSDSICRWPSNRRGRSTLVRSPDSCGSGCDRRVRADRSAGGSRVSCAQEDRAALGRVRFGFRAERPGVARGCHARGHGCGGAVQFAVDERTRLPAPT